MKCCEFEFDGVIVLVVGEGGLLIFEGFEFGGEGWKEG